MEKITVSYDPKQLLLYRTGDETCKYHSTRWRLTEGRGRWGEFPLVVVRKHYIDLGYRVLASEPRLLEYGFILLSYPGKRRERDDSYTKMTGLLGTDLETLDSLNLIADKAKIAATGNNGGGDPDLFVYKPDGSEKFFVEAKWKDDLTAKQLATFPIIERRWRVIVAQITKVPRK